MPLQPSTKPATLSESAGTDRSDPEQELRALSLALSEGEGFRLILATYDVPSVRDALIDRLRAALEQHGVRLTCLDVSNRRTECDLLEALQQHLAANVMPPDQGPRQAVAVVDLETCLDYRHKDRPKTNSLAPVLRGEGWGEGRHGECADYSWAVREDPAGSGVLRRANLQREAFAERIPCPVVLWLMPVATGLFAQEAPDLWHWRIATFDFTGAPTEPVEASDLTRASSFEEFRGQPLGRQHEGIAALRDRLLELEYSAGGRHLAPREESQRAALLVTLSNLGRREEALPATAEAVRLSMPLVERYPQAFLNNLRSRLQNLRRQCTDLDLDPDADSLVRQATELLARLDVAPGK
jgi:hypothetical protein